MSADLAAIISGSGDGVGVYVVGMEVGMEMSMW